MKKTLLTVCLSVFALAMTAMPAKRGVWKTIRLADGTEVRVEVRGDEHLRYLQAEDGTRYVENADGTYSVAVMENLRAAAAKRRSLIGSEQKAMAPRLNPLRTSYAGTGKKFLGEKKGLIILANFSDMTFASGHDKAFYEKLANELNYTESPFRGSVRDYYRAQSNGQFDLTFDVVGPITLSKSYSYYGRNVIVGGSSTDEHSGEMIAEACKMVQNEVNFADYDWDGDGYVDQVFVLYAGKGEADGGVASTIWPHMFYLKYSDYGQVLTLGGVNINTYACSSELNGSNGCSGIGTICHEFSHCLGFADLYDTTYSGGYGMQSWDLLASGGYNGNSFCPANFTGYERWVAGWIEPIELRKDTVVTSQKSLTDNGETYVIYNENYKDELYFLDNRQRTGWDSYVPNSGLLITHLDYKADVWENNSVNDDATHQRYSPFHAGGPTQDEYGSYSYIPANDVYPCNGNDSLTNTSNPEASLFNTNIDGTNLMGKAVLGITRNDDGTMAFSFRGLAGTNYDETPGAVLFNETFDKCSGTGGNDGQWSGNIATSVFTPDVSGWVCKTSKGADRCAKFGARNNYTEVSTPVFYAGTKARLTFKAAPWTNDDNTIDISYNNTTLQRIFTEEGKWTEYSIDFDGAGFGRLYFACDGRFFLDDVKVVVAGDASAVIDVNADVAKKADGKIYTIDGRYVGNNSKTLGKGIYIVNGRKFVK